jgi:D-alanyl-D-alanine carboxypeptidase (penicillin-binding protein 5/6)
MWGGEVNLVKVVLDQENIGAVAGTEDQARGAISNMIPFLTTEKNSFRIKQNPVQALAIGGAATDLDAVLETKAGLSVNFESGEVYYAYNAQARLPMASITKVMTAMVALDLASMEETFTVSRSATEVEPTVMGAYEGEKLTVRELVKAALLMSANDAAQVLAEGIGKKYQGDEKSFVEAMNEKAKIIGLVNTKFTNPQGYDNPEHYSTCEDITVMSRYALSQYPDIARIVKEKEGRLPQNANHQTFWLPNWNMLIGTYPGADGVKIGNTGEAGHTTVASATREGKRILSCVLGAEGILKRDLAAAELLNIGFSKVGVAPYPITEDVLRNRIKDWY